MKLAFIGLGVMGYPMAGHLAVAGHQVTVFNRTAAKAIDWMGHYGGRVANTPAAAARGAEIVLACVGNDDDLREITLGATGAFAGMSKGALFVDHTTASAMVARELAEQARQRGVSLLDAPVSGGQVGAQQGKLAIMVGGDEEDFRRAQPVLERYGKLVKRIGPTGSGQLAKMVNQICIAGLLQSLSEGLNFARAVGLDTTAVVEVISQGAAQSWQMENRYQTMLAAQFDFGFAVDWMRKDLAIAMAEAARHNIPLPITAQVDQFYAEVQEMGGGRWDTSSLIARLTRADQQSGPDH